MSILDIFSSFYWQLGEQLYRGVHGDFITKCTVFIPYYLSVTTVIAVMRQGSKDVLGWWIMLGNQTLWLVWMLMSNSFGFLIMNLFLWYASVRNILIWRKG